MKNDLRFSLLGESTLLVEWPSEIKKGVLFQILKLERYLKNSVSYGVIDYNHTYSSLAITFDPDKITIKALQKALQKGTQQKDISYNRNRWVLPVCYDVSLGVDQDAYCEVKKLTIEKLVELHTNPTYTIFFQGFLPGFMYLGGLNSRLSIPRKSHPDRKIPAGSVAIGGEQTGIYPTESPGGWYVIGNCPLTFFDPLKNPPGFFQSGDELIFEEVSLDRFRVIEMEVSSGVYEHQRINIQ